jgi:hypothetical protein
MGSSANPVKRYWLAVEQRRPNNTSGCADNPSSQEPSGGPAISLALEQFHFGYGAFHWSGRPGERQSVDDRSSISLNAVGETDERTEFTGGGVLQPLVEVTYTPPRDQSTEPLEQVVPGGQALVLRQDVQECVTFVVFELIRRAQA